MRKIIYTFIFVLGMYANVYTAPSIDRIDNMEPVFSATEAGPVGLTVHRATSEAIRFAAKSAVENMLSHGDLSVRQVK